MNKPTGKIAFITSPQLGDALISMVTVNNLRRNNFSVTIFSDYIYALREWFTHNEIKASPKATSEKAEILNFDTIIFTYRHDIDSNYGLHNKNVIVLADSYLYRTQQTMVDIQVAICEHELGLINLTRDNGLTPPANCIHQKFQNRIAIHPTSRETCRSWPAKKFIKLSLILQNNEYSVSFLMSPKERHTWQWVTAHNILLPELHTLADTAKWLYESGFFIGNDSGLGHLASCLNIPTVSLILRRKLANQWRPAWAPGEIVLPPKWLITRPLKERFWRNTISVKRVYRTVKKFFIQPNKNNKTCITTQEKTFKKVIRYNQKYYSNIIGQLINNIDQYLNASTTTIKDDHASTVKILTMDRRKVIIKCYNTKNPRHFIRRALRKTRAANSWDNAFLLAKYGIETMLPIAMIENRFGPLRGKSYLILPYSEGINGFRYLEDNSLSEMELQKTIANIAKLHKRMTEHLITHGDFQPGNLLISNNYPTLIDLDRVKKHKTKNKAYWKAYNKDISVMCSHPRENAKTRKMLQLALTTHIHEL